MIYTEKKDTNENDFISLLESTKIALLERFLKVASCQPLDFERIVYETMCSIAKDTSFQDSIKQTEKLEFPDILAKEYFGVEVKMTKKNTWLSRGNSIFETSRVKEVKRIYILFGKFGGKFDVRYGPYQDCMSSIKVTHSPRYVVNMDLPQDESIFEKMGINYNNFRESDKKIQLVKEYYKGQLKDGEELWWIDDEKEETHISPVIHPFQNLDEEEKERFVIDAMILFPEMFGKSSLKFERAAIYLIAKHNAVCPNLRDIFTAGGQREIEVGGLVHLVPQIYEKLFERASLIRKRIFEIKEDKLLYYWRLKRIEGDRLSQWKKLLRKEGLPKSFEIKDRTKNISAADFFESGISKNIDD
ncbi:MAG: hypothetical protein OXU73_01115 [Candidatus Campbellbacteria bacterium]|nr:hypothetical protein [Candidatus Campbellbacteria bacterium]